MSNPQCDRYRLVLALASTRRIFVQKAQGASHLPRISIPRWTRAGEQVQKAIEQNWGFKAIVIDFLGDNPGRDGIIIAELQGGDPPAPAQRKARRATRHAPHGCIRLERPRVKAVPVRKQAPGSLSQRRQQLRWSCQRPAVGPWILAHGFRYGVGEMNGLFAFQVPHQDLIGFRWRCGRLSSKQRQQLLSRHLRAPHRSALRSDGPAEGVAHGGPSILRAGESCGCNLRERGR
jgi:hypothetical protein